MGDWRGNGKGMDKDAAGSVFHGQHDDTHGNLAYSVSTAVQNEFVPLLIPALIRIPRCRFALFFEP